MKAHFVLMLALALPAQIAFAQQAEFRTRSRDLRTTSQRLADGLFATGRTSLRTTEIMIETPSGYRVAPIYENDGLAIVDGDIALGPASDYLSAGRTVQHSIIYMEKPWPCATVYWRFAEGSEAIDAATRAQFQLAIAHIWADTGIMFVQLENTPPAGFGHVVIRLWDHGYGLSSAVGYSGDEQSISVPNNFGTGGFIHEMGHALGLKHEQQRADRDDYLDVDTTCVTPDKVGNFNVSVSGTLIGDYDLDSIMQYGSTSFCLKDETDADNDGDVDECGFKSVNPLVQCYPILLDADVDAGDCVLAECEEDTRIIHPNRHELSPGDIAGLLALYEPLIPELPDQVNERFGAAVAAGDFNGDSYLDIAVGVPMFDVGNVANAGAVELFYGYPEGVIACGTMTQADTSNVEDGDQFGYSLAVGDFDVDGYDDLVIGAPYEDCGSVPAAGAITLAFGSDDGLVQEITLAQSDLSMANEQADWFGFSLAVGNFDGDNLPEIAVGAPGESIGTGNGPNEGAVSIIDYAWAQNWVREWTLNQTMVSSINISGNPNQVFSPSPMGVAENNEKFGYTLAAGDINDDGHDDLVVGAPYDRINNLYSGSVFLFQGRSSGGPVAWARLDQRSMGTAVAYDWFGRGIAIADLDGDGDAAIFVGASGKDVSGHASSGQVYIFDTQGNQIIDYGTMAQVNSDYEDNDAFGQQIVSIQNTATQDVIVAAPWEAIGANPQTGAVNTYYKLLSFAPHQRMEPVGIDQNLGTDEFGAAMFAVRRDGESYLIAGAPGHFSDRGAAYVYHLEGGDWVYTATLRKGQVLHP